MIKYLILILLVSGQAGAHARWTTTGTLTPRSNSSGIKTGPCGGVPRSATPKIFNPGQAINVQWEETIDHPGRFEIYFSQSNDSGWTLLSTITDTQNGGGTPHQFSANITLPNVNCGGCTLQLIQVMTENPASPSLYFSCADIQLGAAAPPPPPPPPGPPPPAPDPCP